LRYAGRRWQRSFTGEVRRARMRWDAPGESSDRYNENVVKDSWCRVQEWATTEELSILGGLRGASVDASLTRIILGPYDAGARHDELATAPNDSWKRFSEYGWPGATSNQVI